jgi:hypothetical protein
MSNDKISNNTNMIRATVEYDSKPASVTATGGIPNYSTVLTLVIAKLVLIDQLNIIANGTSKGVTLDTKALKKVMCALGGKIGQALAAYAAGNNLNTLFVAADFTEDKLMALKKDDADDKCEDIHTLGTANLAAAGASGYSAADLLALITAIGLYRMGMDDPRQKIIDKTQAIAQIKALQKEIIGNLFKKQLDKMAYTLRGTPNEFFYSGHTQARVIIDAGHTTGKIRGFIKNNLGQALQGVTVTVYNAGTPVVVKTVTTNADGKFSVTGLFGNYDIKYEKVGFQTATEANINVGAGKDVKRDVTLLP